MIQLSSCFGTFFFAHLKSPGNREMKSNKINPYQNQPTNQKSIPNPKICYKPVWLSLWSQMCSWAAEGKGRSARLLTMVMGCNWTMRFSISCLRLRQQIVALQSQSCLSSASAPPCTKPAKFIICFDHILLLQNSESSYYCTPL